ncbi:MAG: diaminopimelate decarboxylase family protein, partial [Thermomicrobiales bacterium]
MLWPETTERNQDGALTVGGMSMVELAGRFGTPLYVIDEATLRHRARRVTAAFAAAYPRSRVFYAGKAYLSPAIVALLHQEGLGLDVVSGGELYAGLKAGVPAAEITFHGNNKEECELRQALRAGVGHIAVDNFDELALLEQLTAELDMPVRILLRVNPGIDVHTHDKI